MLKRLEGENDLGSLAIRESLPKWKDSILKKAFLASLRSRMLSSDLILDSMASTIACCGNKLGEVKGKVKIKVITFDFDF